VKVRSWTRRIRLCGRFPYRLQSGVHVACIGPPPPQPVSGDEAERRRLAVNAERSAYQQQGLRPAGGEPWGGHAGGVDELFFWGGPTGKRAW
jgi:hypothetical protein